MDNTKSHAEYHDYETWIKPQLQGLQQRRRKQMPELNRRRTSAALLTVSRVV